MTMLRRVGTSGVAVAAAAVSLATLVHAADGRGLSSTNSTQARPQLHVELRRAAIDAPVRPGGAIDQLARIEATGPDRVSLHVSAHMPNPHEPMVAKPDMLEVAVDRCHGTWMADAASPTFSCTGRIERLAGWTSLPARELELGSTTNDGARTLRIRLRLSPSAAAALQGSTATVDYAFSATALP